MEKDKKKTRFIHRPEYPGGPKALTNFIYQQLRYPKEALEKDVEGTVVVDYDIDYQGNVVATRVLQGVGDGCDEEACRVVRLLKFDVARNRGLHVLFHQKARIHFKKPQPLPTPPPQAPAPATLQINYTLAPSAPAEPAPEAPAGKVYHYQIPNG
jgi:protein TonB